MLQHFLQEKAIHQSPEYGQIWLYVQSAAQKSTVWVFFFVSDTYILPLYAKSLDFSSCQTLLNPHHSTLRVPKSPAEISDSELCQSHLPAASSDVCGRSSISEYAQLSNLIIILACTHKTPAPKCGDGLASF